MTTDTKEGEAVAKVKAALLGFHRDFLHETAERKSCIVIPMHTAQVHIENVLDAAITIEELAQNVATLTRQLAEVRSEHADALADAKGWQHEAEKASRQLAEAREALSNIERIAMLVLNK